MHIRNYLATLEFVNAERAARGLAALDHLPAGRPGSSTACVIARAIPGAYVGSSSFHTGAGTPRPLPMRVASFVNAFDHGAMRMRGERDPGELVDGGIDDDKGCLVSV